MEAVSSIIEIDRGTVVFNHTEPKHNEDDEFPVVLYSVFSEPTGGVELIMTVHWVHFNGLCTALVNQRHKSRCSQSWIKMVLFSHQI